MYLKMRVETADDGRVAQRILMERLGISKSMAKEVRLRGELLRNGKHYRMVDPVEAGDVLEIFTEEDYSAYLAYLAEGAMGEFAAPSYNRPPITSERIEIIDQDPFYLVVDKPAGITTHERFPGAPDSLDAYLGLNIIHPVNRLDRDTSGLVLLALNGYAHYRLVSQPMEKSYLAVLHGHLPEAEGEIDLPIARVALETIERHIARHGQEARTLYRTLATWPQASLVEFTLDTGRTHQIRVHAQAMGCPLVGDTLYGTEQAHNAADADLIAGARWSAAEAEPLNRIMERQALHAYSLCCCHPLSGEELRFAADLPDDILTLLDALGTPERIAPGIAWPLNADL